MITKILRFEAKKVLKSRFVWIFLLIMLLNGFLIQEGIQEYFRLEKDAKQFRITEAEKIKSYYLISQYGGFGIDLFFLSSPSMILVNDFVNGALIANINTDYRLEISKPVKGHYFTDIPGLIDFSGILYLLGGGIFFLYGFNTFRNREYILVLSDFGDTKSLFYFLAGARLIVATLVYIFILMVAAIQILIYGFRINFVVMGALGIIYLYFLFLVGVFLGMIRDKQKSIIVSVAVYFIFILLLPWGINKVERLASSEIEPFFDYKLKSMEIYSQIELQLAKEFSDFKIGAPVSTELKERIIEVSNNEFEKIFVRESMLRDHMLQKIKKFQVLSSLFPSSFYLSIRGELSSKGLNNLIKFYAYAHKKKKDFLNYYVQKRYFGNYKPGKGNIESFIKGDENIFRAQPRLPYGFWLGVGLTLFYTILLIFFSYRKFARMMAESSASTTAAGVDLTEGCRLNFVFCKSPAVKAEIVRHFKSEKNAAVLQKVNPDDFVFSGVKPVDLFRHLVDVAGVYIKPARENLKRLGISDLGHFELTREVILKIYAAVLAAGDSDYVIIDDYIKRESKEFQAHFYQLVEHLHTKMNKNILYLSCEMYETRKPMNEMYQVERAEALPIKNIFDLTLR